MTRSCGMQPLAVAKLRPSAMRRQSRLAASSRAGPKIRLPNELHPGRIGRRCRPSARRRPPSRRTNRFSRTFARLSQSSQSPRLLRCPPARIPMPQDTLCLTSGGLFVTGILVPFRHRRWNPGVDGGGPPESPTALVGPTGFRLGPFESATLPIYGREHHH